MHEGERVLIELDIDQYKFVIMRVRHGTFSNTISAHAHGDKSYEFHYIADGSGILIADGESYPIEPNSLFMTGPFVVHEVRPDSGSAISEYCINIDLKSTPKEKKETSVAQIFQETTFWIGKDTQDILPLLKNIVAATYESYFGRELYLKGLLTSFIGLLIKNYTYSLTNFNVKTSIDIGAYRKMLIDITFCSSCNTLTLSELSDYLCLSPRQTQRLIEKYYGKSFEQLKLYYRIERAKNHLRYTNMTIREISESLSYSTPEQFSKAFKQAIGMTPSEYRNASKNCSIIPKFH